MNNNSFDNLYQLFHVEEKISTDLKQLIQKYYARAKKINEKDGINLFFNLIVNYSEYQLNDFKLMLTSDIDIEFDNYSVFCKIFSWNDSNVAKYLINNYDIDINSINESILTSLMYNSKINSKCQLLILLLDHGIIISDHFINFICNDTMLFKILFDYNIPINRLFQLFSLSKYFSIKTYRLFADYLTSGITFDNHSLNNLLINVSLSWESTWDEIKQLIDFGADINYDNSKAFSHICQSQDNEKIIFCLNELMANVNTNIIDILIKNENNEIIKILFEKGIPFTATNIKNTMLVFNSNGKFDPSIMELFMQHGITKETIFNVYIDNYISLHEISKYLIETHQMDLNKLITNT